MPKKIMLGLQEANALLVHRMGQAIPEFGDNYDSMYFMKTALEDIFLGHPVTPDMNTKEILMLEGMDEQTAGSISHEVTNTVLDIVTNYLPHLNGNNTGYTFMVHRNMDLEIDIPDYLLRSPDNTAETFGMEVLEAVRTDVEEGHFVPEYLRRLAGC